MPDTTTLYLQAVKLSEEYLGPAGERFMRRQISTHLGIEPESLSKRDVPKLVDWTGLAFSLLTSNRQEIEGFTTRLLSLSNSK